MILSHVEASRPELSQRELALSKCQREAFDTSIADLIASSKTATTPQERTLHQQIVMRLEYYAAKGPLEKMWTNLVQGFLGNAAMTVVGGPAGTYDKLIQQYDTKTMASIAKDFNLNRPSIRVKYEQGGAESTLPCPPNNRLENWASIQPITVIQHPRPDFISPAGNQDIVLIGGRAVGFNDLHRLCVQRSQDVKPYFDLTNQSVFLPIHPIETAGQQFTSENQRFMLARLTFEQYVALRRQIDQWQAKQPKTPISPPGAPPPPSVPKPPNVPPPPGVAPPPEARQRSGTPEVITEIKAAPNIKEVLINNRNYQKAELRAGVLQARDIKVPPNKTMVEFNYGTLVFRTEQTGYLELLKGIALTPCFDMKQSKAPDHALEDYAQFTHYTNKYGHPCVRYAVIDGSGGSLNEVPNLTALQKEAMIAQKAAGIANITVQNTTLSPKEAVLLANDSTLASKPGWKDNVACAAGTVVDVNLITGEMTTAHVGDPFIGRVGFNDQGQSMEYMGRRPANLKEPRNGRVQQLNNMHNMAEALRSAGQLNTLSLDDSREASQLYRSIGDKPLKPNEVDEIIAQLSPGEVVIIATDGIRPFDLMTDPPPGATGTPQQILIETAQGIIVANRDNPQQLTAGMGQLGEKLIKSASDKGETDDITAVCLTLIG